MKLEKVEIISNIIPECRSLKAIGDVDDSNGIVYSRYHVLDIDIFDEEFKAQNFAGVYLEVGVDSNGTVYSYSGKSDSSIGDGIYARIRSHMQEGYDLKNENKPNYANRKHLLDVFTILNKNESASLPLSTDVIQSLEHIFYLILKTANPSGNLNTSSNTVFKLNNDGSDLFKYMFKILNTTLDISRDLLNKLLNSLTVGATPIRDCEKLSVKPELKTEVLKAKNTILKGSYFQIDQKVLRFNDSARDLLTNLINANVCTPYVFEDETIILFLEDVDLTKSLNIRSTTSFNINQEVLKLLMQARNRNQIWIKY